MYGIDSKVDKKRTIVRKGNTFRRSQEEKHVSYGYSGGTNSSSLTWDTANLANYATLDSMINLCARWMSIFPACRTHGNERVGGLRADRVKEQLRKSLTSLR